MSKFHTEKFRFMRETLRIGECQACGKRASAKGVCTECGSNDIRYVYVCLPDFSQITEGYDNVSIGPYPPMLELPKEIE